MRGLERICNGFFDLNSFAFTFLTFSAKLSRSLIIMIDWLVVHDWQFNNCVRHSLRISSTFSWCSRNREIFQQVCAFTTFTWTTKINLTTSTTTRVGEKLLFFWTIQFELFLCLFEIDFDAHANVKIIKLLICSKKIV